MSRDINLLADWEDKPKRRLKDRLKKSEQASVMKFYEIGKYWVTISNRNTMPYYKFWFRKSNVIDKNGKSLGYCMGLYLYFWHISIDYNFL